MDKHSILVIFTILTLFIVGFAGICDSLQNGSVIEGIGAGILIGLIPGIK
jgi:hypothetical protein